MAPEIHCGQKQTSKVDVWSLFVTILWTLNREGFRQPQHFRFYHDIRRTVASLANTPHLSKIRGTARVDPSARVSAAQMLVHCFDGTGLTTPSSRVSPLVDSLGHDAASPLDTGRKAPAAPVLRSGATGRSPMVTGNTKSNFAAMVRGAKKRQIP